MSNAVDMRYMTAADVLQETSQTPAVILPLASVEMLGGHGPIGLDLIAAQRVTPMIAEKAGCLFLPPIPYGDTAEFGGLPGTVHIPESVLMEYILAASRSIFQTCGAKAIAMIAFHSLNAQAAVSACRILKQEGRRVLLADWWQTVGTAGGALLQDQQNGRGHGAEMITSVALALCGSAVRMDQAKNEMPLPGLDQVNRWNNTPFRTFGNFSEYCKGGAWGDLSGASAEKGEQLITLGTDAIASFLREALAEDPVTR